MLTGRYFMYHKHTLFFFALILFSNSTLSAHPESALRHTRASWPASKDEQTERKTKLILLNAQRLRKHSSERLKKILADQIDIFEEALSIHDSPLFPQCLINTALDFIENKRRDFRVSSLLLLPDLMESDYKKISAAPWIIGVNASQNINLFLQRLLAIIFASCDESHENIRIIHAIVKRVLKLEKTFLSSHTTTPTHPPALQRSISC